VREVCVWLLRDFGGRWPYFPGAQNPQNTEHRTHNIENLRVTTTLPRSPSPHTSSLYLVRMLTLCPTGGRLEQPRAPVQQGALHGCAQRPPEATAPGRSRLRRGVGLVRASMRACTRTGLRDATWTPDSRAEAQDGQAWGRTCTNAPGLHALPLCSCVGAALACLYSHFPEDAFTIRTSSRTPQKRVPPCVCQGWKMSWTAGLTGLGASALPPTSSTCHRCVGVGGGICCLAVKGRAWGLCRSKRWMGHAVLAFFKTCTIPASPPAGPRGCDLQQPQRPCGKDLPAPGPGHSPRTQRVAYISVRQGRVGGSALVWAKATQGCLGPCD